MWVQHQVEEGRQSIRCDNQEDSGAEKGHFQPVSNFSTEDGKAFLCHCSKSLLVTLSLLVTDPSCLDATVCYVCLVCWSLQSPFLSVVCSVHLVSIYICVLFQECAVNISQSLSLSLQNHM